MQRSLAVFFILACSSFGFVQGHFLDDLNEVMQGIFVQYDSFPDDPAVYEPERYYESDEGLGKDLSVLPETRKQTIYRDKTQICLDDVRGQDEVVTTIRGVVEQLKNPTRLKMFGGRPKKGILLEGPPGTGKTLLAQAVANELGYSFHNVSGSEFVEVWVGQGAQRVRDLFSRAQATAPAVIFIDEVDAIAATSRDESSSNGSLEYRQTLNELLTQMNKLDHNSKVLVICATNTIEAVDAAFKAPHRFEIITVGLPNAKGRRDILMHYLDRLPRADCSEKCIDTLVEKTKGFSGAQLESLVSSAVHFAVADLEAHALQDKHLTTSLEAARHAMKTGMFGSSSTEYDNVLFSDIAGLSSIKKEFKDLLFFLKHPEKLRQYGVEPPKGILLAGRPGVGKTMLVRALANEADCPVFYASGADFDGKYLGEGAQKIDNLFEKARMVSPAIIFIDEIDAISGKTGSMQTVNKLLTKMDGFSKESNVIVIGATNRPREVDRRLRRPGRFTEIHTINLPTTQDRKDILSLYVNKLPRVSLDDVPYDDLVAKTSGMSGAALKDIVNEAASLACKEGAFTVSSRHFYQALNKALYTFQSRR